jgi:hypothetical protein
MANTLQEAGIECVKVLGDGVVVGDEFGEGSRIR